MTDQKKIHLDGEKNSPLWVTGSLLAAACFIIKFLSAPQQTQGLIFIQGAYMYFSVRFSAEVDFFFNLFSVLFYAPVKHRVCCLGCNFTDVFYGPSFRTERSCFGTEHLVYVIYDLATKVKGSFLMLNQPRRIRQEQSKREEKKVNFAVENVLSINFIVNIDFRGVCQVN
jgi:hypothetical protein